MAARRAEVVAHRAEAALKAAELRRDEARRAYEAAELEAAALTAAATAADFALPEAKRRRTHAALQPWEQATTEWSVQEWIDFEGREQKRRAVPIGSSPDAADPQRGPNGFLHHWRGGLLGAIKRWAHGSERNVVNMIMSLIGAEHGFGIEDAVRARLKDAKATKAVETDTYIVDRAVAALDVLKRSGTAQARREYHIILGALAPVRVVERGKRGMGRRVAARLRVRRGRRARTQQQQDADELGRPFAFLQATIRRAAFDAAVEAAKQPFREGDAVLAGVNGQPGTLMSISGSGCTVEFRIGEVYEQITYAEMDRKAGGKGNARLTHPPPSLAPDPRAARSDGITPETIALVRAHVEAVCARSPHQRDAVCRRLAAHLKQEAQALILTETRDELFESFEEKHPGKIKRAKFYEVLPWELKEAYRETCLCASCENLKLYLAPMVRRCAASSTRRSCALRRRRLLTMGCSLQWRQ